MAREYEGIARALASKGRYGDSMLMHVNPAEVEALQRYAPGGITINPDTGQPEAFLQFLLPAILAAAQAAAPAAAAAAPAAAAALPAALPAVTAALPAALPTAISTGAAIAPEVIAAAGPLAIDAASLAAPAALEIGTGVVPAMAEVAAQGLPLALETGATAGAEIAGEALPYALGDGIELAGNIGSTISDVPSLEAATEISSLGGEAAADALPAGETVGEGVWSSGVSDPSVLPINEGLAEAPEYLIKGFQDAPLENIWEGAKDFVTELPGKSKDFVTELPGKFWDLPLDEKIMLGSLATGAGTMIAEELAGDEGPPEGWGEDEDPGPSSYAGPASWSGDITRDPSGPAPWADGVSGVPVGDGYIAPTFDASRSPYVETSDLPGVQVPPTPGVYETGGEGLGTLAEAVEPLGGGIVDESLIPEGMDLGQVMAGFEELRSSLPAMSNMTIEDYIAMLNQQNTGVPMYG